VNPKLKGRLLVVLERFLALEGSLNDEADALKSINDSIYEAVSSLFSYFKDQTNRDALGRVLHVMAATNHTVTEVAHLCADINAFVEDRIDTPDYDRRLQAFSTITKKTGSSLTPRQWLPLLHNAGRLPQKVYS
jgi:U3 small nucleolar RNA-associated protein 20